MEQKKATIKETVTAVTDTSPVNGSSNLITSNAVYGVKSEADANRLMELKQFQQHSLNYRLIKMEIGFCLSPFFYFFLNH